MTTETGSGLATNRLVAHLDHGECYAENYTGEDLGAAIQNLVEVADELAEVTTHANVRGPRYEERKIYYRMLRKALADEALLPLLRSLELRP